MSHPKPERGAPREPLNIPARFYGADRPGAAWAEVFRRLSELTEKLDAAIKAGAFRRAKRSRRTPRRKPR